MFKNFHKDSVFRVPLARNKLEQVLFGLSIFIGLVIFLFSCGYVFQEKKNNANWACLPHIFLILYVILISVIRILTIDPSFQYFKNNLLNHFYFIWLILIVSNLFTFPPLFLFDFEKTDESSICERFSTYFVDNFAIIFGILSIILFSIFINDILNKNMMQYLFYTTIILICILFVIICMSVENKQKLLQGFFKQSVESEKTSKYQFQDI